jgi:hypothetical protein
MFQGVAWTCELFPAFRLDPNMTLEGRESVVTMCYLSMRNNFRHSNRHHMQFRRGISDVSKGRQALRNLFRTLALSKCDLVEGEKPLFKGDSFSASGLAKNATWARSEKRCFKGMPDRRIPISVSRIPKMRLWRSRESGLFIFAIWPSRNTFLLVRDSYDSGVASPEN